MATNIFLFDFVINWTFFKKNCASLPLLSINNYFSNSNTYHCQFMIMLEQEMCPLIFLLKLRVSWEKKIILIMSLSYNKYFSIFFFHSFSRIQRFWAASHRPAQQGVSIATMKNWKIRAAVVETTLLKKLLTVSKPESPCTYSSHVFHESWNFCL